MLHQSLRPAGLFVTGLMLAFLAVPMATVAAPGTHSQAPRDEAIDLESALARDGTFVGREGVAGSVDASKWTLVSDISSGEAPRFEPAASESSVAVPFGEWAALGESENGLNGALNALVNAIAMIGDDLYVGGNFSDVAGIDQADYVARWDGANWHALGSNGSGTNGALGAKVNDFAVHNGSLYVAGNFMFAANILQASYVARWNGTAWSALGSNQAGTGSAITAQVRAVESYAGSIVVGGDFTNVAGIGQADYVARWNGSAWSALGSDIAGTNGALTDHVWALLADGSELYVGGLFVNAKGIPQADYVARWSGSDWFALGSDVAGTNGALNSNVTSLVKFQGDLILGGAFVNVRGMAAADFMVRWGGGNDWSNLGTDASGGAAIGSFGIPYDWAVHGTDLFVIGSFVDMADDPLADYVARWDGTSWHPVGSNGAGGPALNGQSYALLATSANLFAGGQYTDAASLARADYIAVYGLAEPRPDGRIKRGSGTLVGNNIYNLTGLNQTRTGKAPIGATMTFAISIQNDGTDDSAFSVYATGPAAANYQVKYFRGTTDITGPVVTGAYQTPSLTPGSTYLIKAKVTVLAGATVGSSVSRLVSINSVADPLSADVVKFVGKRK